MVVVRGGGKRLGEYAIPICTLNPRDAQLPQMTRDHGQLLNPHYPRMVSLRDSFHRLVCSFLSQGEGKAWRDCPKAMLAGVLWPD